MCSIWIVAAHSSATEVCIKFGIYFCHCYNTRRIGQKDEFGDATRFNDCSVSEAGERADGGVVGGDAGDVDGGGGDVGDTAAEYT